MGLVNIFNIQKLRPHINYRFSAEIWPNAAEGDKIEEYTKFQYTIKKITQPVYKLDTENKKVYGNTAYVVPIFKYGETSLEITFEETDKMEVFKQLCTWMGPNLYKGYLPPLINIRVTQFNESMAYVVDKKVYVCRLKEHGMPSFNNNGFGSPIEITATFNVVYVMDEPLTLEHYTDNGEISRYTTEYTLPDNKALNDALKETLKSHKNAISADKVLKAERALADKRIDELANENLDLNQYMMERLAVAYAKSMENASPEKRALMQQIAESKGGSTMANQTETLLNFLNANVRAEHGEKTKQSVGGADYELIAFNAANGADNYETEAIERFLKFTNADEETVAEIGDILYKMNENVARIDELNKPITDADELAKELQKDYPTEDDLKRAIKEAVGMEVDIPKKSATYNGNDSSLGAVSYQKNKGPSTKNFIVDDKEVEANWSKLRTDKKLTNGNLSKETVKEVLTENAKRMKTAYTEFKNILKTKGIKVSINAYNDTEHATGIDSNKGSHLQGQKVDLNFVDSNNRKLKPNNMTDNELDLIIEAAEMAGLTVNWETTGEYFSGWGDFALKNAKGIDKNGNIVDVTTTSWTGKRSAKNIASGKYDKIGYRS